MAANPNRLRILMFPWLGHSHVHPYLRLAKKLSNTTFRIFFCSTPIIINSIKNPSNFDFSDNNAVDHAAIQFVQLHLPSPPELPPHFHTTKNVPPHLLPTLIHAFQMSGPTFSAIISDLKPDLLIYDVAQPWSAGIAASHGVPAVHFATSGSAATSFFHHLHTHTTPDTFPFQEIWLSECEKRELNAIGESVKARDGDEGFAFGILRLSCDVVLIRSCRGIEGKYMDYLSSLCERKLIPTGPLVSFGDDQESTDSDSDIMNWLDQKRPCSTLYISFGSENYFSKEQIMEIARGLEMSDANFIWVARSPAGDEVGVEEVLPDGFLERVRERERGMIVQKWAPQAAILAHSSVAGFMSHCGWSSVTESLYFGVPVVALPLKLDQPVNARLVAAAGAGVEVMRDDQNGRFDGNAVAEAVKEVVGEESGKGIRRRARELSEKMKMEEEDAMNEVVVELLRICRKK